MECGNTGRVIEKLTLLSAKKEGRSAAKKRRAGCGKSGAQEHLRERHSGLRKQEHLRSNGGKKYMLGGKTRNHREKVQEISRNRETERNGLAKKGGPLPRSHVGPRTEQVLAWI